MEIGNGAGPPTRTARKIGRPIGRDIGEYAPSCVSRDGVAAGSAGWRPPPRLRHHAPV